MSQQPSVILLLSEPNEAYAMRMFFERHEWQVETCKELEQCWRLIGKNPDALLIVDVLCMSNAQRTLLDHPLVIHQKVPMALYCHRESRPLLQSVLSHWNMGTIEKTPDYASVLIPIMLRHQHWVQQNMLHTQDQAEISQIRRQYQEALSLNNNLKFKLECHQVIEKIDGEIKKLLDAGDDFFVACAKVLQQQSWVSHFTFFGLLENGRRLYSPELPAGKCHSMPEIFLPVYCPHGMVAEAQALAIQLFSNVGDGQLMMLEIEQQIHGPKFLLMLKTPDRDLFQHMELDALERIFDYNFQRSRSKGRLALEQEQAIAKLQIGPWELASFLESSFHRLDEEHKLLSTLDSETGDLGELMLVDLAQVLQVVQTKKMGRFYWQKFARELQAKLTALLGADVHLVEMGLQQLYILSQRKGLSQRLELVQNYLKGFPIWRYFEQPNHTQLWGVEMTARMVPLVPASIKQSSQPATLHALTMQRDTH